MGPCGGPARRRPALHQKFPYDCWTGSATPCRLAANRQMSCPAACRVLVSFSTRMSGGKGTLRSMPMRMDQDLRSAERSSSSFPAVPEQAPHGVPLSVVEKPGGVEQARVEAEEQDLERRIKP